MTPGHETEGRSAMIELDTSFLNWGHSEPECGEGRSPGDIWSLAVPQVWSGPPKRVYATRATGVMATAPSWLAALSYVLLVVALLVKASMHG